MDNLYLNIAVKLLAGFIVILVYIRLAGKGSLAPISALDQVGNMVLGAIIGGSLYNHDINVVLMVGVSGVWAGLLLLIRYVSFKKSGMKDIVDGRSIPLIRDGVLLTDNFAQARISVRDFIMLLHQRGFDNLDDLQNVWFEYNGQMTVVKKGDEAMATMLVDNGQPDTDNLERLGFDNEWVTAEVERQGYKLEDVFLAEWHHDKLWIYPVRHKGKG